MNLEAGECTLRLTLTYEGAYGFSQLDVIRFASAASSPPTNPVALAGK